MARGWQQFIDENRVNSRDKLAKTEKIKKDKRSSKGRTVDDWLVDAAQAAKVTAANVQELGSSKKPGFKTGRVIEVHKRNIFIAEEVDDGKPDTGLLWLCSVAKRHFQRSHGERNFVVVGDRVVFHADAQVEFDESGEPINTDLPRGVIQHAYHRTSRIARRDPMRPEWEHVMLANIDLVAIVASVFHPEVRWGLIDRFLVQSEMEDLPAAIILNKVDLLKNPKLATPEFLKRYESRVEIYRKIGYEVIEVCALHPKKTLEAVKHLRGLFKGKLVGFCGHSGVGKSSILNLMKPEFEQVVDENPEIFYKGRHTTTYNSLLKLGIGAYAIDTPGIRSFSVEGNSPSALSACFREFAPFKCKFSECAHDNEGEAVCGIKKAVSDGFISKERYRSYLGILKGVSFREGEGDDTDSAMIADLKARVQGRDEELANESSAKSDSLGVEFPEKSNSRNETPSVLETPETPVKEPKPGVRNLRKLKRPSFKPSVDG